MYDMTRAPGRTAPFFLAAFGITWGLQLPAVLIKLGLIPGSVDSVMPLVGLGAFGPLLAAILASYLEARRAGVRSLFGRLAIRRVGAGWYGVALGIFSIIYVAGVAVYSLVGANAPLPWFFPPENAQRVAAMVVFPIGEEPGWRGFALPRLQNRYRPLTASLALGCAWAAWHVPMFLIAGMSASVFLISALNILAGSVIFSWIFNRTRGSLLLAVLAHVGAHLCNPTQALPGNALPFIVFTAAVCVAAVGLVLVDRGATTP